MAPPFGMKELPEKRARSMITLPPSLKSAPPPVALIGGLVTSEPKPLTRLTSLSATVTPRTRMIRFWWLFRPSMIEVWRSLPEILRFLSISRVPVSTESVPLPSLIVSPHVANAIAWRSEQSVGHVPAPVGSSNRVGGMSAGCAAGGTASQATTASARMRPCTARRYWKVEPSMRRAKLSFDTTGLVAYVNGEYKPVAEASVSIFDHGFLYGDGVFEGMRVFDGGLFRAELHMERITRSALRLGLGLPAWTD